MSWAYMGVILLGLAGMAMIDWRYKAALFYDARRTVKVLSVALVLFLVWDWLGITLHIFFAGASQYMLGVFVAPDVPIEEPFLLLLCNYIALIMYRIVCRKGCSRHDVPSA